MSVAGIDITGPGIIVLSRGLGSSRENRKSHRLSRGHRGWIAVDMGFPRLEAGNTQRHKYPEHLPDSDRHCKRGNYSAV